MKAVVCNGAGDVSVMNWVDAPIPEASAGEVLIRVEAAGVNRPDILQRMGLYRPPTDASPILGLEVAGEIVVGDLAGSGLKVGDRVCALTHGGGYAKYVCVKVAHCLPIPEGWTMIEAASLPETFFTVWFNVFEKAALGALLPETLLVHAGASGIGVAAIQIAHAMGQMVYATARSPEKRQACLDLGAAKVFDTTAQDWVEDVVVAGGVDVILDVLAGDTLAGNIKALKPHGRLAWIAFLTGNQVQLNVADIMAKEICLTGSYLRRQSDLVKAQIAAQLHERVWPHLVARRIRPVIDAVYNIEDVRAAHERMEQSAHIGKIILQLST